MDKQAIAREKLINESKSYKVQLRGYFIRRLFVDGTSQEKVNVIINGNQANFAYAQTETFRNSVLISSQEQVRFIAERFDWFQTQQAQLDVFAYMRSPNNNVPEATAGEPGRSNLLSQIWYEIHLAQKKGYPTPGVANGILGRISFEQIKNAITQGNSLSRMYDEFLVREWLIVNYDGLDIFDPTKEQLKDFNDITQLRGHVIVSLFRSYSGPQYSAKKLTYTLMVFIGCQMLWVKFRHGPISDRETGLQICPMVTEDDWHHVMGLKAGEKPSKFIHMGIRYVYRRMYAKQWKPMVKLRYMITKHAVDFPFITELDWSAYFPPIQHEVPFAHAFVKNPLYGELFSKLFSDSTNPREHLAGTSRDEEKIKYLGQNADEMINAWNEWEASLGEKPKI
jgi:hypothetical protein